MRTRAGRLPAGLGPLCAAALGLLVACGGAHGDPPPNVLFVLADDLRWDALGAYGNPVVPTPRLDAFAAGALRFERFYVASPVCSPSRASFLTGLAVHQPGIELGDARRPDLAPGVATVARELGAAGYTTAFIGKAHLGGDPLRWGFDEAPLVLPGRRLGDPGPPTRQELVANGRHEWIDGHASGRLVDAAIAFVERQRGGPWLLWLATSAPHHPYTPDPRTPVDAATLPPPPGWPPGAPFEDRAEWAGYYSLIGGLDRELGRLLARLDELGLAERTLVWITSDNGVQLGSHGLAGKAVWYDASTRVPALVRWPGATRPGAVATPASSLDLLPTLLEIAQRPLPPGREGRSLVPLLRGGPERERIVFSEVLRARDGRPRWRMASDGRAKWVVEADGAHHLYDLLRDPGELVDLAAQPHPRRSALEQALARWGRGDGATQGAGSRSR